MAFDSKSLFDDSKISLLGSMNEFSLNRAPKELRRQEAISVLKRLGIDVEAYAKVWDVVGFIMSDSQSNAMYMDDPMKNQYTERLFQIMINFNNGELKRIPALFAQYADAYCKKYAPYFKNSFFDGNLIEGDELVKRMKNQAEFDKFVEWAQRDEFYNYIPCFSEGSLKVYNELVKWFVTDFEKTDDDSFYVITLFHYFLWDGHAIPTSYTQAKITYSKQVSPEKGLFVEYTQAKSPANIYDMINPKAMRWNDVDRKLWKKSVLKISHLLENYPWSKNGLIQPLEIFQRTLQTIGYLNYLLAMETPTQRKASRRTTRGVANQTQQDANERKERIIAGIKIISVHRPKVPCYETVRKYNTESWQQRGFVRHYKSGKTVYIQPQVKHRRCVTGMKETAPKPQILKVKPE